MKRVATVASHAIGVRPMDQGWELLCTPGPLSWLFFELAGADSQATLKREAVEGQMLEVVPLTPALDQALAQLVDALIGLRYETGRVQLELFATEEL